MDRAIEAEKSKIIKESSRKKSAAYLFATTLLMHKCVLANCE